MQNTLNGDKRYIRRLEHANTSIIVYIFDNDRISFRSNESKLDSHAIGKNFLQPPNYIKKNTLTR